MLTGGSDAIYLGYNLVLRSGIMAHSCCQETWCHNYHYERNCTSREISQPPSKTETITVPTANFDFVPPHLLKLINL